MSEKPRLTLADAQAYQRARELAYSHKSVTFGEERGITDGLEGDVLVFKIKGKLVRMKAGDPRLLELKPCDLEMNEKLLRAILNPPVMVEQTIDIEALKRSTAL